MRNISLIQAILAISLIGLGSQISGMEGTGEYPIQPTPRHVLPHSTPTPTRAPSRPIPSPSPIKIETLPDEPPTPRTQKKQEAEKETQDQSKQERLNAVLKDLKAELKKLQAEERKLYSKIQKKIEKQGKVIKKDGKKKDTKIENLKHRYTDLMLKIKRVKENIETTERLISNISNRPIEPQTVTFDLLEPEGEEEEEEASAI